MHPQPKLSPETVQALAVQWASSDLAKNTRLAYASDWRDFNRWCGEHAHQPLPAAPSDVTYYVAELLANGRKVSTAGRRATSIAFYHRQAGLESPCRAEVWSVITGARRDRGEQPLQKRALMVEDLRAMVETLKGTEALRTRNRAILLLGFASALRRSNIVALDLADLSFEPGGVLLTIRHEKQDRVGRGRIVPVPHGGELCPVKALRAWLAIRGDGDGPLFSQLNAGKVSLRRLHPGRVMVIVKEAAEHAGRDPRDYSAHSLRAGFATESLSAGVGEIRVAAQTGHRCLRSLKLYYRPKDPFRGHPCSALGL